MARWALSPAAVLCFVAIAAACPFCTAVKPSLSQRREEAAVAALVELSRVQNGRWQLAVHKTLAGAKLLDDPHRITLETSKLTGAANAKAGQLALLLATREGKEQNLTWEFVALDEIGYSYVARAPSRRLPPAERLSYYAKYLEHANPLVAEDAYLEFGHASYDEVAQVADQLPFAAMRQWIVDPMIPEARKGFYGLALGLAKSEQDRRANMKVLRKLIDTPAADFRAGYDGILGGYLVLAGSDGLAWIEEKLLADPQARPGDLRHAATALRFIHEFGHGAIPAADLKRAMRRLLVRPELAAAAFVDLARWQDWECLDAVVALFDREEYSDPATSRAIVGYLVACPRPAAAEALARLRRRAPQRVAEAEQQALLPSTGQ
jgi:hypothetical protein